jgi:hypothetical protein
VQRSEVKNIILGNLLGNLFNADNQNCQIGGSVPIGGRGYGLLAARDRGEWLARREGGDPTPAPGHL